MKVVSIQALKDNAEEIAWVLSGAYLSVEFDSEKAWKWIEGILKNYIREI